PVHGERGLEGCVPPGRGGDGYATAADDERPTTGDLRLAVLRHEELGDLLGAARVPDQPHVLAAEVVGVDEVVDQLGEVVRFAVPVLPPGDGAGGVGGEHGDECVALRVRHLNEAAIPAERVRVGRVQVPIRAVAVEVHHQARPSGQPFTEDVKGAGEAAGVGELDVRCVDQLRRDRRVRRLCDAGPAGQRVAVTGVVGGTDGLELVVLDEVVGSDRVPGAELGFDFSRRQRRRVHLDVGNAAVEVLGVEHRVADPN